MPEVELSEHGDRVFSGLARQAATVEEIKLAPLSAEEASEFFRFIDKIEMNFRTHSDPRRPTLIHTATAISKRRIK
jgi:hypothetical protein